jgi:hypothetical protein
MYIISQEKEEDEKNEEYEEDEKNEEYEKNEKNEEDEKNEKNKEFEEYDNEYYSKCAYIYSLIAMITIITNI